MRNKMLLGFMIAYLNTTAFAYTIGQQFTVDNLTDKNLLITIDKINNQAAVSQLIPAKSSVPIYTENGDNSGWLYQIAVAPFKISDENDRIVYIRGNIVFVVWSGYSDKYSFLDNVLAGKEINLDLSYSCRNGGNGTVFQNKITIKGSPTSNVINIKRKIVSCDGLKSSMLDKNLTYHVTCKDSKSNSYQLNNCKQSSTHSNTIDCTWKIREGIFSIITLKGNAAIEIINNNPSEKTINLIQNELDKDIGNNYCESVSLKVS